MDIVIVGSCNVDLVCCVPRLPKPGETLHGYKFTTGFGGKGANQCIMAARLGAKSAMVAKVGDDNFGANYIQNFKDNFVNIDHVTITKEAATGVAPIAVDDNGQNSIIIVSGANLLLGQQDLSKAEEMIKSTKIVICQLETSIECTLAALQLAKKHSVQTILNPAPAVKELPEEIYSLCDIFCPNETEAEILTGHCVSNIEDAKFAANILLDRGCATVILTLGDKGAILASQKKRKPIHISTPKVTSIDTTGAGDAFVGALAFYLAKYPSFDTNECIKRACAIAAITVQRAGTQTSFPWRKDLPSELF